MESIWRINPQIKKAQVITLVPLIFVLEILGLLACCRR